MQKNLRWKLILMLIFMVICAYYFISPREKGAPWFSRLNLGLDLKGGIHLLLKVKTDEALDQEIRQDVERIAQEFRTKSISFDSAKKGSGNSIDILGVDAAKANEARAYLETTYNRRYSVRSSSAEGKTNLNMTLMGPYLRELQDSTVRQALETIRRRVDALGVTEPTLQIYGSSGQEVQDEIIVELPGIDDPERVKDLISQTSQLKLCLVKKDQPDVYSSVEAAIDASGGKLGDEYEILPYLGDRSNQQRSGYYVVRKAPVITGKDLKTARKGQDSNGANYISFFLNADGAERFSEATGAHVGEFLAIILDNIVRQAPRIKSKIEAEGVIEGSFTAQEADDTALLLRSGALPASLEKLEEHTVGASLGNDSIKSGIYASLIGFGIVVIGMFVYYRHSGFNAVVCLLANLLILMGFLGAVGATLTLPGIAGIILTIGMAVDANILIFERIREELRNGKTVRAAIDMGFSRVFWTIFDSNVTTLIAAAFLFQFGTGPIRGFAVTLTVGLLANMFTAIYMSHRLFDWTLGSKRVEVLSI